MGRMVIWPGKRREVADRTLIGWAQDHLATEYMRRNPHAENAAIEENARVADVLDAVEILTDAGLVTFEREV